MHEKRLPALTKLAYGAGEFGPAMAGSTLVFFLLVFLTDVAGLPPALAGSVLLVGKIWDAVNDPLIGWLTDRTRSRWGRRLPWLVYATGPFALFFFLQWVVPIQAGGNTNALFWFYVVVTLVMNTLYTAVTLPYAALTPELTHDYDERTRLVGFRQAFSLAGSVGGLLIGLAVFSLVPEPKTGQYLVFGGLIGGIILLSLGFCIAGIWRTAILRDRERLDQAPGETLPIRRQLALVLQNKPFLIVCAIYLCSWIAVQFTAGVLPYYVEDALGFEGGAWQVVALVVQVTALGCLPFWSWLATRIGKKIVYGLGMVFWIAAQAGLLFLPPQHFWLVMGLALLAGLGVSVAYLIPFAMLPDVIELDEIECGQRREGVFYGFVVFLQKTGLALSQFIVGIALSLSGYLSAGPGAVENPVQPESAIWTIRVAIGPLPMLALLAGLFFVKIYPITKARHQDIRDRLAARQNNSRKAPPPAT